MAKEYEIIIEFMNGCAGSKHPIRSFEEVELEDLEAYVRDKHKADRDAEITCETTEEGIQYTVTVGVLTYRYIFTEI